MLITTLKLSFYRCSGKWMMICTRSKSRTTLITLCISIIHETDACPHELKTLSLLGLFCGGYQEPYMHTNIEVICRGL